MTRLLIGIGVALAGWVGALAWQVIGDAAAVGAVAIASPSSPAGASLTFTLSSLTAPVAVGI